MTEDEKFFRLFGGIFFAVGVLLTAIGLGIVIIFREWFGGGISLLIGLVFDLIGGGILIHQFKTASKRNTIKKKGKVYPGKIYGYIENKSGTMNGDFLVNIKVHYFDDDRVEREAIIPTGFVKGTGNFPIGATIDIIEYNAAYSWVEGSVRYETLPGEAELMDDLPVDPSKINMIAVACPNCGATFSAAKGYVSKCPYCDNSINC